MAGITDDLNAIKTLQQGLVNNKVTRFAYEQSAYDNNEVAGQVDYVASRANNIPMDSLSVMQVNQTVVDKGFRARASSIPRMLLNHLFGRISYNLNKLNDLFFSALSSIISSVGQANGLVPLDSTGRISYQYLPEDAITLKGTWNASTNTPTLADGTGDTGDTYIVSVAGTQNLGSGDIQFFVNDRVIYNGSIWQRFASGDVKTVCEIAPDSNGNVDLSQQTDMTKIFPEEFLTLLFQPLIGKIWYAVTSLTSISFTKIIYANNLWVGITSDSIYWSEDGMTWTQGTINTTGYIRDIAFCEGNWSLGGDYYTEAWCACGSDNNGYACVWVSGDGKSWRIIQQVFGNTRRSSALQIIKLDIYNVVSFAVVLQNTDLYSDDKIGLWYNTGFNFPSGWKQANQDQRDKSFGCLFMKDSSNILVGSSDSEGLWFGNYYNLTQVSGETSTYDFNTVYYANSLFQAGSQGHGLWWSSNGTTFTQATGISSTASIYSVHYANGIWVATTSVGMFWSSDGKAWTAVTGNNLGNFFRNADFNEGMWIAVTNANGIWWSNDAKYWTKATGELTSSYKSIAYKSGMWAIAGSDGIAYSNYDAISKYFADGGIL